MISKVNQMNFIRIKSSFIFLILILFISLNSTLAKIEEHSKNNNIDKNELKNSIQTISDVKDNVSVNNIEKDNSKKNNPEKKKKDEEEEDDDDDENEPENDNADEQNKIVPKNKKTEETKTKFNKEKKINTLKAAIDYINFDSPQTQNKLLEVKEVIEKELKNNQQDPWKLYYYKGLVYSKLAKNDLSLDNNALKKLNIALSSFNEALKYGKNNIELKKMIYHNKQELQKRYYDIGLKIYKKGDYEETLKKMEIIKNIDDKFFEPYLLSAIIYYKLNDLDNSLDNCETYFKLGGKNSSAFYIQSYIYEQKTDINKALKVVNNGLNLNPFNNSLIYRKVNILKMYDKKFLNKNLTKWSALTKSAKYYQKAVSLDAMDKKKEVGKLLKKASQHSNSIYEIQLYLGIYYFNKAAELSQKIDNDKFDVKKIIPTSEHENQENHTKEKIKNKKNKKKFSPEYKMKKYLELAKEKFVKANKINSNQLFIEEKIKFIEDYLKDKNEKKKNLFRKSV